MNSLSSERYRTREEDYSDELIVDLAPAGTINGEEFDTTDCEAKALLKALGEGAPCGRLARSRHL